MTVVSSYHSFVTTRNGHSTISFIRDGMVEATITSRHPNFLAAYAHAVGDSLLPDDILRETIRPIDLVAAAFSQLHAKIAGHDIVSYLLNDLPEDVRAQLHELNFAGEGGGGGLLRHYLERYLRKAQQADEGDLARESRALVIFDPENPSRAVSWLLHYHNGTRWEAQIWTTESHRRQGMGAALAKSARAYHSDTHFYPHDSRSTAFFSVLNEVEKREGTGNTVKTVSGYELSVENADSVDERYRYQ